MNLRVLFFHNFWLKALSVFLATVIWLAIHNGIKNDEPVIAPLLSRLSQQQYVEVPVSLVREAADRRHFRVTPDRVVVTAAARGRLQKAASKDLRVYVDLTAVPDGSSGAEPLHADVPGGLTVLKIEPATVDVEQESGDK